MGFALAVFFGRVPNEVEMAVGHELAKARPGFSSSKANMLRVLMGRGLNVGTSKT